MRHAARRVASRARRLARFTWFSGALLGSLAAFALIGIAHTPIGRPLLDALRGAPGCPMARGAADGAQLERNRIAQLERRRGEHEERGRPAAGYELGRTHRREVLASMRLQHAHCEASQGDSALRCTGLPHVPRAGEGPRIEDIQFRFDPRGRLVALDLFRTGTDGAQALRWLSRLDHQLESAVGRATDLEGERNGEYLERWLRRMALHYRYQGYVAQVSAMNYGRRGVRVREQYQWLPDASDRS
jgi:hypothetical protein